MSKYLSSNSASSLYDSISPFFTEEQKTFFNSAAAIGTFWEEKDFVIHSVAHDNSGKQDQKINAFEKTLFTANEPLQAPSFCTSQTALTFAKCSKCSRTIPLALLLKHEDSCQSLQQFQSKQPAQTKTYSQPYISPHSIDPDHSTLQQPLSSHSTQLSKAKKKEKDQLDLERHCGVLLENGQQCLRALTCKTHSMSAKRSVPGRGMDFDRLLAIYKTHRAQLAQETQQQKSQSPSVQPSKITKPSTQPPSSRGKSCTLRNDLVNALPAQKSKFNAGHLEPVVIIPTSNPLLFQSNSLKQAQSTTNTPKPSLPSLSTQTEQIANTSFMQSKSPAISTKEDHMNVFRALIENDSYFESTERLCGALKVIYDSSLQPVNIRKTEVQMFNPISSSILPVVQELYNKKMQHNVSK